MSNIIASLLFPQHYRQIPHRRLILNALRSAHLTTISILVGGFYFQIDNVLLSPWLVAAIATGLSMFMLDLYESAEALFEVRGVSVLLKMSLLLCIPLIESQKQTLLLIFVIILSAFISHSTKRIRHKNFLPVALQQHFGMYPQHSNQFRKK